MRNIIVATAALLVANGCEVGSAEQAAGAVRVQTEIEHATLYVDARERGALNDGMEVRLSAGPHVLEARRNDVVLAAASVEAQAARIFDVQLASASAPADHELADSIEGARAAPPREPERMDLDELIENALGNERPPGGAISQNAEADEGPPETPDRYDVARAMAAVSDQASACGGDWAGLVPVRVVFVGSGRATEATVTGSDAPPAVRSCITRAVRLARVPPFTRSDFTVNYPFRL